MVASSHRTKLVGWSLVPTEQNVWGWLLVLTEQNLWQLLLVPTEQNVWGWLLVPTEQNLWGWSLVPTEQNLWGWSLVPALTPLLINIDRLIAKLTKKEIIYIKSIYTVWLIKEYASLDHYKSCDAASFLTMKRFWVL